MSGIRALERKAPTKPMTPRLIERVEHEYIRHGTLSLIANFEVATGRVLSPSIGPTRNEADFATHIENTIDTDPSSMIPKHTSWLNQIELWFSILARRLLKRASFTSIEQLSERILAFIQYFNQTLAKPFRWTYKRRPLTV